MYHIGRLVAFFRNVKTRYGSLSISKFNSGELT